MNGTATALLDRAPDATALVIAMAVVGGACWGLISGYFAVLLERWENLEKEDQEDLEIALKEVADAREAALVKAQEAGEPEPPDDLEYKKWTIDPYGWTWLEKYLSPGLGAASFGLFTWHQGLTKSLAIHLVWVAIFVHIIGFDLKHRLILNKVTYPAVLIAVGASLLTPGLTVAMSATGAVVIYLFFWIQNIVSRGSIGLGDAKLGALIGAVCGLGFDVTNPMSFAAIYASVYGALLGGAVALVLLVLRIRGLKDPIPYGPFLCAGAAFMLYQLPGT